MHGTTKGRDVHKATTASFEKAGGPEKCSVIVITPAMLGKKTGLVGLLKADGVECPTLHCVIHQEALCGKSIKQEKTFKTVVKVINMIRGGNRALLHRKLQTFLEANDAEYGDLLLYNEVRWLSAGGCLRRFFGIRKKIPVILDQNVSAATTVLKNELQSTEFLKELAFLADITHHLNNLNLKLQAKDQLRSSLVGHINGFRSKLKIFVASLERNDLTHFESCGKLFEDFGPDEQPDFSEYAENLKEIESEFMDRFKDFDILQTSVLLFTSPLTVDVEIMPHEPEISLELCDLQADPFLKARQETGKDFFKLPKNRFPHLRRFGPKMTSMFGSTLICECTFSVLNRIKTNIRSRLSDESLKHLLRLATTNIAVDIDALVSAAEHPQVSH